MVAPNFLPWRAPRNTPVLLQICKAPNQKTYFLSKLAVEIEEKHVYVRHLRDWEIYFIDLAAPKTLGLSLFILFYFSLDGGGGEHVTKRPNLYFFYRFFLEVSHERLKPSTKVEDETSSLIMHILVILFIKLRCLIKLLFKSNIQLIDLYLLIKWLFIYSWIFDVFQPMDTSNHSIERGYPLWFVCQNRYIGWFNFNWYSLQFI